MAAENRFCVLRWVSSLLAGALSSGGVADDLYAQQLPVLTMFVIRIQFNVPLERKTNSDSTMLKHVQSPKWNIVSSISIRIIEFPFGPNGHNRNNNPMLLINPINSRWKWIKFLRAFYKWFPLLWECYCSFPGPCSSGWGHLTLNMPEVGRRAPA